MFHLAQINIARLLKPIDDPQIADFVNGLDEINALAERSPGFVWRLVSEDGNDATEYRPYDDDRLIVNVSVWEDVDSLRAYTYRSGHVDFFIRRKAWFEPIKQAHVALWWVPAGQNTTLEEAVARLEHLRLHGSSPTAFSIAKPELPPSN
ncbi:MAG: DUF3291 domain-containing protein [Candidatus Promineifilaceae bacterium]